MKITMKKNLKTPQQQSGAALAVGLILLVIITLMGYASMKGTMLQEKMAAGLHNRALAQGGANSALRAGEDYLYHLIEYTNGVNVRGTPNGSLFRVYSYLQDPDDATQGLNNTVSGFKQRNTVSAVGTETAYDFATQGNVGARLKTKPRYLVEQVEGIDSGSGTSQQFGSGASSGNLAEQKVFLVTGKSQSGDGKTFGINQSMYSVAVSAPST